MEKIKPCQSTKNFWRFEMIEVKDNFMEKELFHKVKESIISSQAMGWFLETNISGEGEEENCYFTHLFFSDYSRRSENFSLAVEPLAFLLQAKSLIRAKANLYPRTDKLVHHKDHIDYGFPHKAAVFYLNTNNGYTVIGDRKIESVENRVVIFDPTVLHHSTNCTDAPFRANININYF